MPCWSQTNNVEMKLKCVQRVLGGEKETRTHALCVAALVALEYPRLEENGKESIFRC